MNPAALPITKPHDHLSETFLALLELVECKDIKDQMDAMLVRATGNEGEELGYDTLKEPADRPRHSALMADYLRRKPAAWVKAREVLHNCGWHMARASQPEEGRMLVLITESGNMCCGMFDPFFGTPGKKDGYVDTRTTKRGTIKEWISGVIAWSYAQLPRF